MARLLHHQWNRRSHWLMVAGLMLCVGLMAGLVQQSAQAAFGIANPRHEQSMLWPLLPGESINSLAAKLYPQSPVLQQRFVQQSLTLSRSRGILLTANQRVDYAQLIAVPNAQALHTVTHRIKKADEADPQMFATQGLVMSLQMRQWEQSGSIFPSLSLPSIQVPVWMKLNNAKSSASELTAQVRYNFQSNIKALGHMSVKSLSKQPHLVMIVSSGLLLLVLVAVWGLQRKGRSVD
ncbi:MAG TPA: hypothetical protein VK958_13390 [Methylophilus sp.]|uniref:hypothetical protein n=1 Tax=Methylophilus sp. TaxID=29541 RepID=UPI002B87C17F|nr:hypothetical protein [Methylophilus sp.]HSH88227.1 hypothetical protein [Methylophilus sp.]